MRRTSFLVALLVWALGPALASASPRGVYLNGVRLDESVAIPPTTLTGCEVRIDARGDVFITARNYKLMVANPSPPTPPTSSPPPPVAPSAAVRSTWLITKQTRKGGAGFDVLVTINDVLVRKIVSTDDPVVLDVSRYVQSGRNTVRMVALKNPAAGATSSPADILEIVVGEGVAQNGMVTVGRVHGTVRRNGSETGNLREDFTFDAP